MTAKAPPVLFSCVENREISAPRTLYGEEENHEPDVEGWARQIQGRRTNLFIVRILTLVGEALS